MMADLSQKLKSAFNDNMGTNQGKSTQYVHWPMIQSTNNGSSYLDLAIYKNINLNVRPVHIQNDFDMPMNDANTLR